MPRAKLFRRIEKLELRQPVAPRVVENPLPQIIEELRAMGFDRGPNESWAEVTARAMGMSYQELNAWIDQRIRGC